MEIRVIDFEILTRHYKNYREGVDKINNEKDLFLKRLEPFKKEMNAIIAAASSGIIVDQKTQQQKIEEFQRLQDEAVEMDKQFKFQMKEMREELNSVSYDELSEIITAWAESNSIDIVSGKMEIVFSNPKFDATDSILEILKEKNLFVDFVEEVA
jgi:Skp family chaperone for outer membrane proteins